MVSGVFRNRAHRSYFRVPIVVIATAILAMGLSPFLMPTAQAHPTATHFVTLVYSTYVSFPPFATAYLLIYRENSIISNYIAVVSTHNLGYWLKILDNRVTFIGGNQNPAQCVWGDWFTVVGHSPIDGQTTTTCSGDDIAGDNIGVSGGYVEVIPGVPSGWVWSSWISGSLRGWQLGNGNNRVCCYGQFNVARAGSGFTAGESMYVSVYYVFSDCCNNYIRSANWQYFIP